MTETTPGARLVVEPAAPVVVVAPAVVAAPAGGFAPLPAAVTGTATGGFAPPTTGTAVVTPPATTGGVVDRLEQRGALERRTAPTDRRARQLWITDAGARLLAEAVPAMLEAQRQILAPLTERQQAEFMRLLRILVDENNALSRAPSEALR